MESTGPVIECCPFPPNKSLDKGTRVTKICYLTSPNLFLKKENFLKIMKTMRYTKKVESMTHIREEEVGVGMLATEVRVSRN